jgi:hypothetical protein
MAKCVVVAVSAAMVVPCMAQPASNSSSKRECSESAARFSIGQAYSDQLAERAREVSGARIVRRIEPGGAYTMELRADRLNLELDAKDVVQGVNCG